MLPEKALVAVCSFFAFVKQPPFVRYLPIMSVECSGGNGDVSRVALWWQCALALLRTGVAVSSDGITWQRGATNVAGASKRGHQRFSSA